MKRVDAKELEHRLAAFMMGQKEEMTITRMEAAFLVAVIGFYDSEGKMDR